MIHVIVRMLLASAIFMFIAGASRLQVWRAVEGDGSETCNVGAVGK